MFAFFAPGVGGCNMIFDIKLSPVPRGFVNVLFRPLNKSHALGVPGVDPRGSR